MDYEFYDNWEFVKDFSEFTFISLGKCGPIPKKVLFDRTEVPGLYNLVFGDVDDTGEIDDYSISDNGDRNKILATVAKIVERYTDHYPERWICFTGSTEARTRLYRMAIGMNLE